MRFLGFDTNPTMILKFPDLNTLRLALNIKGGIPENVCQAGAVAGYDGDSCWVETSASLVRGNQNEIKKIGVQTARSWPAGVERIEVSCWPEILPLERDRIPVEQLEQTPVLFDLPNGEELARLVIEVLRLGNDRQGFRWLEGGEGEDETRALLRVVGPPYYSLLRAMDRIGGTKAPVAFVERSPRIWVEIGYSHPLIGQIKAPKDKILLIRPPRQWVLLDEAPYRDVYENTEFLLPDGKTLWKDGKLDKVLPIRMSLRAGGTADGAEFWVLRDNPIEELNNFVQNSSDETIQRLAFAVGEKGNKKTIVVRVRQSRQAPPVLIFKNAVAYKHYQKMPNLFVPAGFYVHPNLRRDQLRKLLCEDQAQVVWLQPGEKGTFAPMGLPEDSFRPLWDWVDYVLDHEKEPLAAWVQASQFDFEAFTCDEDPTTKPKKPPSDAPEKKSGRSKRDRSDGPSSDVNFAPAGEESERTEELKPVLEDFSEIKKVEPSEWQKQLKALEESFLELDGGLDAAERQEMWPRLASLNTQLKNVDDAGICWLNAMWERDEQAARAWAWLWFLSEAGAVQPREGTKGRAASQTWVSKVLSGKVKEVPGEDLDRLLGDAEPNTSDLRALAAYLTYAGLQNPPLASVKGRLSEVSSFLEQHERLLPVRAMWMAWVHLTMLSSGDVLALARARDRLLERLYNNGLRPEQDLPSFLRFAGQPTSQRFRAVRQWMSDLADLAQSWLKESGGGSATATAKTSSYVELLFSFGLARLGENDAARELLAKAKGIADLDEAHHWLFNAFEYRIKQSLDGKSPTGPLPNEQLEKLEKVERLQRYVVDRLRKHSSILEPDQRINPYRHWGARISDFEKALAELTDLTDRTEIQNRVDKLLREIPKGARGDEQKARVLRAGLEASPRVGEDFARKLLDQTVQAYDKLPEAKEMAPLMEQAAFLEKALFVAGHFGRMEAIHPLVSRFQKMLQSTSGTMVFTVLEELAKSTFRGLRKLGMRDEIDQILRQMGELILKGRDVKSVDFKKEDGGQGPSALCSLLQVAGQWYYFGRDSQAEPILQVSRSVLLANDLAPRDQTKLAKAYAAAVGEAPVEIAQKRLEEVFKQLKGIKDTYTTSSHFSVSQLDVVESVVLAVVGDNFTQGTQARRWLDDDEFLVRRRIHRDLRTAMERG